MPNINNLEHWGVSATLEWKLSDTLSLKSITAYRDWWNNFGRDSDGTPLPNNATYDESKHRQFTQEIQLTGTAGKLDWAAGAFYYDAHDSNQGFDFLYPTIIYQNDSFDRQDTTNWAVFAQGTFHATDQFSIHARRSLYRRPEGRDHLPGNFFGTVIIDNQFVPTSTTNTDYTVAVDYKWSDELMTYLKYATGFKGGGFSPRPANPLQTDPFDPEYLKTLELGAKSEFAQRRVRLNGAVFVSRYEDQQTFAQQLDSSGQNWFREINAGKPTSGASSWSCWRSRCQTFASKGLSAIWTTSSSTTRATRFCSKARVQRRAVLFPAHAEVHRCHRHAVRLWNGGGRLDYAAHRCRLSVGDLLHHQQPGSAGWRTRS